MPGRRTLETHRFTLTCAGARPGTERWRGAVGRGDGDRARERGAARSDCLVTYEVIAPIGDYAGARARAFARFKRQFGADAVPRLLGWVICPCLN